MTKFGEKLIAAVREGAAIAHDGYIVYACQVCGGRIEHPAVLRSIPYHCEVPAKRVATVGELRMYDVQK